jgi:selenocysteine-specific elongation factor
VRRAILGTAGHIDHGKTALVRALTGVDTDRLQEEKERGITIELGFAELREEAGPAEEGVALGVVDVPGHEDFVRTMVAGASGVDVVLLAVAADEGMMPQTREHLAVVELLGVPALVVALTKTDLVEEEWLALVREEVEETLAGGPWPQAPVVATSAARGDGVPELRRALLAAARTGRARRVDDLVRLPVDRSFTVQGTGTVVTGTLWSGRLEVGRPVRVLPAGVEARVRGIQHHGEEVQAAEAGARTAVALAGGGVDRDAVERGQTLVDDAPWERTHMLTVHARVLEGTGWELEHNQRLHLHLATGRVLARCAVLDGDRLASGSEGWVQLRLEEPVVARARDRVVLRSYSPVTTVAGGRIAEPAPPKRRNLDDPEVRGAVAALLDGSPDEAVEAAAVLGGWAGVARAALPLRTGLRPRVAEEALEAVTRRGGAVVQDRLYAPEVVARADRRLGAALDRAHEADALAPAVPLASLRQALPGWAGPGLADARIRALESRGELEVAGSGARRRGWTVELDAGQEEAAAGILASYREAGLQPPQVDALPRELRGRADLEGLLRHLEERGELVALDDTFRIDRGALEEAVREVRSRLEGRSGLGPADFREALPVTRKHLLPLLAWMDRAGVTLREAGGRRVLPTGDEEG